MPSQSSAEEAECRLKNPNHTERTRPRSFYLNQSNRTIWIDPKNALAMRFLCNIEIHEKYEKTHRPTHRSSYISARLICSSTASRFFDYALHCSSKLGHASHHQNWQSFFCLALHYSARCNARKIGSTMTSSKRREFPSLRFLMLYKAMLRVSMQRTAEAISFFSHN